MSTTVTSEWSDAVQFSVMAVAFPGTEQAKLLASDPAASDYFGVSVSLSSDGNTALIGAHNKTGTAGAKQGAAYVYTRSGSTWAQQAKLLASDPATGDNFGYSVSLSSDGNTALIGAYVFTRSGSTWAQQAKLLASDPATGDYFGVSVSLSSDGNTALIGAYSKTGTAGWGQGAAYVYTRSGSTWAQQAKLLASDPAASDSFGLSVSLSSDGNTALIGAYNKSGAAGASQGAAYVYTRSGTTWAQQAKLLASDPAASDSFGLSVSLSSDGNTALIGAHNKSGAAGASQGAAYVYTRSGTTWAQQAKLLASDPAASDNFGYSVSLSSDGNTALIGAYTKTGTAGGIQGAAYVFTRSGSTWAQQAKLLASDPAIGDYFTRSVSLSSDGNTALIGAYSKTGTAGARQGAAYVFT